MKKKLTKKDRGIIIAMVLGDGHFSKTYSYTRGKTVALEIGHSIKQLEYCKYKSELLGKTLGVDPPKIHFRKVKCKGKEYETCRFSKGSVFFYNIRKKMYIEGRKIISMDILNYLTPEGLAIWYMDDGSCRFRISEITNEPIDIDLRIATCNFSFDEHKIIVEYFKKVWDIDFKISYRKKLNLYDIKANKKNALKFIELIKPYVISSMMYKCLFKSTSAEHPVKGEDIV